MVEVTQTFDYLYYIANLRLKLTTWEEEKWLGTHCLHTSPRFYEVLYTVVQELLT